MITKLDIKDVPMMTTTTRYYDGELFFADNITSVPTLARVFQVRFVAIVICVDGELKLRLNSQEFSIKRFDALFVDAATIVDIVNRSPDFSCKILATSADTAFSFVDNNFFEAALEIQASPVIHLSDEEISLMLKYYELADYKLLHAEVGMSRESIGLIVKAYACDLLTCAYHHFNHKEAVLLRQGDKLYRRFMTMLARGQSLSRSVQWYADELCVSPKYLTTICRQHAKKTAGELIAMSMVGRIKQMLLYSDLSIKEISSQMGFTNLSFFGKYVKKHLGLSPNAYRNANGYTGQ